MKHALAAVAVALTFAVTGCSSSPPPAAKTASIPPSVPSASEEPAKPKRQVPAGQLRREDVLAVLSEGPPAFLSKVDVEPLTDKGGRFLGWKVVAIHDAELAAGDLKPGDVVTRVNGRKIESPFDFYDAFQGLAFAKELRVEGERGGAPLALRWPISDDPSAPAVPRAEDAPPKTASSGDRPKR